MATSILSFDAQNASILGKRSFGLGGAVFSPTLHGRITFDNLDASVKDIDHSRVLTTVGADWGEMSHMWFLITASLRNDFGPDWKDVIDLYEGDPQNFMERSFNEFTFVDLADTLKAVEFSINQVKGKFGYYNAYINTGLRLYVQRQMVPQEELTREYLDRTYDRLQDIRVFFKDIDRPLLVYFSQDDPILSSYKADGQPEALIEILKQAEKNPNITVFNPKYGAHIGALLDPVFGDLIHSVFREDIKALLSISSNIKEDLV